METYQDADVKIWIQNAPKLWRQRLEKFILPVEVFPIQKQPTTFNCTNSRYGPEVAIKNCYGECDVL